MEDGELGVGCFGKIRCKILQLQAQSSTRIALTQKLCKIQGTSDHKLAFQFIAFIRPV